MADSTKWMAYFTDGTPSAEGWQFIGSFLQACLKGLKGPLPQGHGGVLQEGSVCSQGLSNLLLKVLGRCCILPSGLWGPLTHLGFGLGLGLGGGAVIFMRISVGAVGVGSGSSR